MLPWIKHWRDWAMPEFWSMHRMSPQPQALHYSYEKAGLILHDQPIPWNAEVVLIEARLRLPSSIARRKTDFQLQVAGQAPVSAEHLRRHDGEEHYRLFFRLPVPTRTASAELLWRNHCLGQMTLPYLEKQEFIQQLRLQMPTLFVRLAEQSVACQTFVSTQCRGLVASAILASPTSLAPLVDLGLHVEFRSERGNTVHTAPVQLASSQLAERQALAVVIPRKYPRHLGTWLATWMLGDYALATQRVRAISVRHFQRSLRVADTRFILQGAKGKVTLARQLPAPTDFERAGPCFLVGSREVGMAGLCTVQVRVQGMAGGKPAELHEQEVLITDGPTAVTPGTLAAAELAGINGFELRLKNHVLGAISTTPIPAATFNNEGGFKPLQDFPWSPAADEELNDRLGRLLEERGPAGR
jgi:hypothetical protein